MDKRHLDPVYTSDEQTAFEVLRLCLVSGSDEVELSGVKRLYGVFCNILPLLEHCSQGRKTPSSQLLSQSCPTTRESQAAPWEDKDPSILSAAPVCCMFAWWIAVMGCTKQT